MLLVIWIAAFAVLMIIEAATLGLTTVWFAGGALISAILAAIGAPLWLQVAAFVVVSAILLVFTRPIVNKHFNKNRTKTNVEGMIDKKAYVTEEIDNIKSTGQVKIDGMDWTARTEKDGEIIAIGTLVKVVKVEGVKAIVEEIKED